MDRGCFDASSLAITLDRNDSVVDDLDDGLVLLRMELTSLDHAIEGVDDLTGELAPIFLLADLDTRRAHDFPATATEGLRALRDSIVPSALAAASRTLLEEPQRCLATT